MMFCFHQRLFLPSGFPAYRYKKNKPLMKQYSKPPGVFMYSNYDMDHSMTEQYSKPPGVFMYSNYDMDHSMTEQYSKPPCIKMEYSRSFKFKIHEKAL